MSAESFAAPSRTAVRARSRRRVDGVAPAEIELTSCVPARLSVGTTHGDRVLIPPLGTIPVERGLVDPGALRSAEHAGLLTVTEVDEPPMSIASVWATLFGTAAVLVGLLALAAESTGDGVISLALPAVGLGMAAAILVSAVPQLRSVVKQVPARLQLPDRLREALMFALATAIVFALPGAILYFGSDVPALWDKFRAGYDHDAAVALIGIGVQFVCIVGASALPVLLYFIFDRERMLTLRQRVTRSIFRLDASVRNLGEIDAKYGQWLDEAFGRRQSEARFLPGTRWPILIAAAVLTLGWAVALLDTKPATVVDKGTLTALITPTPAAPTFAFLGAYFFALNSTLRGFVRGDLRPKTYAQVATRIVGSVVLAFTLERLVTGVGVNSSSASLLIVAFMAGVVPETALIRLQEAGRGFLRGRSARRELDEAVRTYETEPLTRLQGIDIYDRARLLDEGVTNVEGLAHHDIVELLLKTRIPATRLLDWVDQAILFIHCCACSEEQGGGPSVLTQLRAYGIRTATGLRRAHAAAADKQAFLAIVDTPAGKPPVIGVILDALEEEDWMKALAHWHAQPARPRTIKVPEGVPGSGSA